MLNLPAWTKRIYEINRIVNMTQLAIEQELENQPLGVLHTIVPDADTCAVSINGHEHFRR